MTPLTSFNRDVTQEVVRRILNHYSSQMTAHYARLHETAVRRAREAVWAKRRLGRATQALPNGYCGLPLQQSCPHAHGCPMFLTTPEFLPQHRVQRQ